MNLGSPSSAPLTLVMSWWNLRPSDPSIGELSRLAQEASPDWDDIDGLIVKLWFADEPATRWGGLILWSEVPPLNSLPANTTELVIGRPSDVRAQFRVTASVFPEILKSLGVNRRSSDLSGPPDTA